MGEKEINAIQLNEIEINFPEEEKKEKEKEQLGKKQEKDFFDNYQKPNIGGKSI